MQSSEPTWWYVSLDANRARQTAVRVLGTISLPVGSGWLVQVLNQSLFNTTKLLLVPSAPEGEAQPHPSHGLVPVRAYDGGRLHPGEVPPPEFLASARVLDIGGVASGREEAQAWSRI